MTEYLFGETIRIGNTFTDIDEAAYDPDTLSISIYDPEDTLKTTATYAESAITRSDTGVYYYDYNIPSDDITPGYYYAVWTVGITVGDQTDISEEQFYVRAAGEKLYVSVSEVKASLMASGMTMSDDTVRNVIRMAMGEVEAITGRLFTNGNTYTEWFNTDQPNMNTHCNSIELLKLPVQSITTLKEYDTAKDEVAVYTDADYFVEHNVVELMTGMFVHQRHRVECVYTYGYTRVPVNIQKLTSVIGQVEVMRHSMIAADDQMTSFSIPEIGEVSLGEVYVTSVRAIEQLEKQKKGLIATIGNLRNDTFAI